MEYMIAIVQCYIHHKKNVEVDIALPSNTREVLLLQAMFTVANKYVKVI